MKCKCGKKAIYFDKVICEKHFLEYYTKKVSGTISKFRLFQKDDRIAVAVSGGKDSLSAIHVLSKLNYNVTALAVDEGIFGYREHTLKTLKQFCANYGITLKIYSFKEEFGTTLDKMHNSSNKCTTCGVLRRYILNKYSRGYDVLVTGHNLDDEAQAVLMNLFKNNLSILARLGPVSGQNRLDKFTKRVKPLYYCYEEENIIYSVLNKFSVDFKECPYIAYSFRAKVRNLLNTLEEKYKGTKQNIIDNFLSILPELKENSICKSFTYCKKCGDPSANEICNACALLLKLNK
ncbi:TIGR00269 family protein [Candidatus Woesearchaeota archaeon]|nr:TIGR00269 family protein [Candidatus Woesearchaeota archaeon]